MSQHREETEHPGSAPQVSEPQDAAARGALSDGELDAVSGGVPGLKLMSEMLSNVPKTRSEIAMTFARNAHG